MRMLVINNKQYYYELQYWNRTVFIFKIRLSVNNEALINLFSNLISYRFRIDSSKIKKIIFIFYKLHTENILMQH